MSSSYKIKKPNSKINPDFLFSDLVDVADLQQLVNHLSELSGLGVGITDSNKNILVTCGWKKICSAFHRIHPISLENCLNSNNLIKQNLGTENPISCKCNNGLRDIAYPIFIKNKHVASIYIGQFLYDDEKIDKQYFELQAKKYGFDKKEYMNCLKEIPLISHQKEETMKNFAVTLAQMFTKTGYANLLLRKEKIEERRVANEQIKDSEEKFKTIFNQSPIGLNIYDIEGNLLDCNPACLSMFGFDKVSEVIGLNLFKDPNLTELQKKDIKAGKNVRFELRFDFELVKRLNIYKTNKSGLSYFSCFATTLKTNKTSKTGILLQLIEITARKKSEFILKEENNRFTTTMNAIDSAVYVADMENHEILFVNKYVEDVFGDIIGKKCYVALQGKKVPCDFCTNHLLLDEKGKPTPTYIWEFQNLITKRWYQCHDQAIRWTNGRLARFETATDITINKENEQKLKEHELKLEELNATKDKFFSIIAHDLKNPFTVLKNGSYLLSKHLENNDVPRSIEKANMISNSVKNGYSLLENLLMWSKSQTGIISINIENVNLKNKLAENIKELENHANQKEIVIINKISDDLTIEADDNLLAVVFRNLITNAIKFTNSGGTITILAKPIIDSIEIAIIDTGIGIPKEHQHRLFKLDDNYSRVGTAKEASSGLGLILCKEFIEKHNGKIWFESKVDRGTTFKMVLPLKQN